MSELLYFEPEVQTAATPNDMRPSNPCKTSKPCKGGPGTLGNTFSGTTPQWTTHRSWS